MADERKPDPAGPEETHLSDRRDQPKPADKPSEQTSQTDAFEEEGAGIAAKE